MNTLLLVGILCVAGCLFAVPLFEFVFATLLIAPLFKFLAGKALLAAGAAVEPGLADAALYLGSFAAVMGFTYAFFGKRRAPLTVHDFAPIAAFAAVFAVAYGLCLLWPDFIPMGERLRDYALLASSIDSPVVPKEPWMEGATLNYYVFWYRFGGMLNSLLHMPAWDAYHTILSFSLAFYSATIFQLVRVVFGGSPAVAAFTAIVIPFGSNIAGVMGWKRAEGGGFEPDNGWWGPSRVIKGAIDEFPAWSFLLGDAHPHFLNIAVLPFFILILYRIVTCGASTQTRAIQSAVFVLAGTLFLVGSNAWEVPMWLGIAAILALVGWMVFGAAWAEEAVVTAQQRTRFDMVRVVCCLGIVALGAAFAIGKARKGETTTAVAILVAASAFGAALFPYRAGIVPNLGAIAKRNLGILVGVFWVLLFAALKLSSGHIESGESGKLTFVRDPVFFTSIGELWAHWGFQLFFISAASLLLFEASLSTAFIALFLALTLLFEKAALFIYVLIGIQLLRFFTSRESLKSWRDVFIEAIAVCSLGLLLLPEVVFLNDSYGGDNERMNTIFKIYTTDWALLGLAAVALSLRVYDRYEERLKELAPGLVEVCFILVALVVVGASAQLYAHTVPMRVQQKPSAQRWSEGLSSPDRDNPGSATIIRVLRERPKGVVLEAQGNPYSYTAFVSTLASQPSYLGWANHIGLLTKKHEETGRRTKVTEEIYTGTDCEARKALAKKEGIRYVILGTLEKKKYAGVFDRDFGCLTLITHDRDYWLFEVE